MTDHAQRATLEDAIQAHAAGRREERKEIIEMVGAGMCTKCFHETCATQRTIIRKIRAKAKEAGHE